MPSFKDIYKRLDVMWQLVVSSLQMTWRLKLDNLLHFVTNVIPIVVLGVIVSKKSRSGFVGGMEYYLPFAAFISYEYQKFASYVSESIHFGDMGIHRLKPYSFYSYNLTVFFASNVLTIFILLPVVFKLTCDRAIIYLIAFSLGVTLRFTWCYLVATFAYSLKRMDNILIVEALVFMAIGGLIPLGVMQAPLSTIIKCTPYFGMYHLVYETTQAFSIAQIVGCLGLQLLWIIILRMATCLYEESALKAYDGAVW